MADAGRAPTRSTIPGAIMKRPVLVAAITLTCALLGMVLSRAAGTQYEATAKLIVEPPASSANGNDNTVPVERFVNNQVALFDLESLQRSTAELAQTNLHDIWRQQQKGTTKVGSSATAISIGQNGEALLPADGARITLAPDRTITFVAPQTPSVRADGTVLGPSGQPVTDANGTPITVRDSDALVARADGLLLVQRPGASPIVIAPTGSVVDPNSLPSTRVPDANATTAPNAPAAAVPTDIVREPNGTITTFAGDRGVRLVPTARPVLIGADGSPVPVPGRQDFVGAGQQLLLLDRDGGLVARGDDGTIVVPAGGASVAVLDDVGQVLAQTADATISASPPPAPAPAPITVDDVRDGLSVKARADSNLLEVRYQAADAETAKQVANAAVAAYESLRNGEASSTGGGAQTRAQQAITDVSNQLASVDQQITSAQQSNPDRADLNRQYNDILRELASAGRQLLSAPAQSAAAAQRIEDLNAQLTAIDQVTQVEQRQPVVAQLLAQRDQLANRLAELQAQLDTLRIGTSGSDASITVSSPASEADLVAGLGPLRLGFVGAVLGFLIGAGVAYLLELRRPTVESADEMAAVLGLPLLGEIPDFRHEHIRGQLPVVDAGSSYVAEAFRISAATAAITFPQERGALVGVVSAGVGDGKTTVAMNLALALAQTKRRVLALDADLEGQVMSLLLQRRVEGVPNWKGMIDVVEGRASLAEAARPIAFGDQLSIDLLPAGAGAVRLRGVLDTKDVTDVFAEVAERYDAVVLDVPPLLNVSYAGQVLREVDGAVIVGAAGTAVNHLTELRDRLALLDVRVIGFIYNRGPLRPERTASIAALHYDLGGKRAPLGRRSRRRKSTVPAGTIGTTSTAGNGAVDGAPKPSREPR